MADEALRVLERARQQSPDDPATIRSLLDAYERAGRVRPYDLVTQETSLYTSCGRNAQGMEEFRHKTTGMMFVLVPDGSFKMGAPEDQHERTFSEPFLMAKYPWTAREWHRVTSDVPSHFPTREMVESIHPSYATTPDLDLPHQVRLDLQDDHGKTWGDHPVESISWDKCQEVTDWINRIDFARRFNAPFATSSETPCWKTWNDHEYGNDSRGFAPAPRRDDGELVVPHFGKLLFPATIEPLYEAWLWNREGERCGFQLPTESMWEYATRAGATTRYPNGETEDDLAKIAWFGGEWDEGHKAVGLKDANNWGLHDNCGNVFEWTRCRWRQTVAEGDVNGFVATGETRRDLTEFPFVRDDDIFTAIKATIGKTIFELATKPPTTVIHTDAPPEPGDDPFDDPEPSTSTPPLEETQPGLPSDTQSTPELSSPLTFPPTGRPHSSILQTFPFDVVSGPEDSRTVTPPEASAGQSDELQSELPSDAVAGPDQSSAHEVAGEPGDLPFTRPGESTSTLPLRVTQPGLSSDIEDARSSTQDSSTLHTSPCTSHQSIFATGSSAESTGATVGHGTTALPDSQCTTAASTTAPASARPGEPGDIPFLGSISLSSSNFSNSSASQTSSTSELGEPPLTGSSPRQESSETTTSSEEADQCSSIRSSIEAPSTHQSLTTRQGSGQPGERGDRPAGIPFSSTESQSSAETACANGISHSSASSPCLAQSEESPSTGHASHLHSEATEVVASTTWQLPSTHVLLPGATEPSTGAAVLLGERGDGPFELMVGSEWLQPPTLTACPGSIPPPSGTESSQVFQPVSENLNQHFQSEDSPGSATPPAQTSEILTTSTRQGTTAAPGALGGLGDDPFVGAHRSSSDGRLYSPESIPFQIQRTSEPSQPSCSNERPSTCDSSLEVKSDLSPGSSFPSSDGRGQVSSPPTSSTSQASEPPSEFAQETAGTPLPTSDGRADDTDQNTTAAPEQDHAGGLASWFRRVFGGRPIGISSRGTGNINTNAVDDFQLLSFDIVSDPAVSDAFPSYLDGIMDTATIAGNPWAPMDGETAPTGSVIYIRRGRFCSLCLIGGARASWRSRI